MLERSCPDRQAMYPRQFAGDYLSELNAEVSRTIGDCALRALAPDPEQRYANPEEFKAALLAVAGD